MIKRLRKFVKWNITAVIMLILSSCGNNSTKYNGDINSTENFTVFTGIAQYDTLPANLTTHKIVAGDKHVFIYERTGSTMIDVNDWDAKYIETLIFQIDTSITQFNYCDSSLKKIDCKYYWICLSKEIKKEIRNINKGCIKGKIYKDSINIDIDINPEFTFGGHQDNQKERLIKYRTTCR